MALEVSSVEMEVGNWLVGAAWGWIFLLHKPISVSKAAAGQQGGRSVQIPEKAGQVTSL